MYVRVYVCKSVYILYPISLSVDYDFHESTCIVQKQEESFLLLLTLRKKLCPASSFISYHLCQIQIEKEQINHLSQLHTLPGVVGREIDGQTHTTKQWHLFLFFTLPSVPFIYICVHSVSHLFLLFSVDLDDRPGPWYGVTKPSEPARWHGGTKEAETLQLSSTGAQQPSQCVG